MRPEFEALLAVVRQEGGRAGRPFDPARLVQLALKHGLIELAHRALNPVPGLREAAFVQQACTRAQLRVAAEVAGALAS
ncbi:MAG: hypothetical protein HYY16_13160, partial [Planctomycetes bacterium]|nr:hypothetical protein [Planctomycetota bacterium]